MKYQLILTFSIIIGLLFHPNISLSQKCALPAFLNYDMKKTDSNTVYASLILSSRNSIYFKSKTYNQYMEPNSYRFTFKNKQEKGLFDCKIARDYNLIKTSNLPEVNKIIKIWCTQTQFLDRLSEKFKIDAPQILFEEPSTRNLFRKYLTNKYQTWESLSSHQESELYIRFMNFVETLSFGQIKELDLKLEKGAKKIKFNN